MIDASIDCRGFVLFILNYENRSISLLCYGFVWSAKYRSDRRKAVPYFNMIISVMIMSGRCLVGTVVEPPFDKSVSIWFCSVISFWRIISPLATNRIEETSKRYHCVCLCFCEMELNAMRCAYIRLAHTSQSRQQRKKRNKIENKKMLLLAWCMINHSSVCARHRHRHPHNPEVQSHARSRRHAFVQNVSTNLSSVWDAIASENALQTMIHDPLNTQIIIIFE